MEYAKLETCKVRNEREVTSTKGVREYDEGEINPPRSREIIHSLPIATQSFPAYYPHLRPHSHVVGIPRVYNRRAKLRKDNFSRDAVAGTLDGHVFHFSCTQSFQVLIIQRICLLCSAAVVHTSDLLASANARGKRCSFLHRQYDLRSI